MSEPEKIIPFNEEWKQRITKELRDDATSRLKDTREAKAKAEKQLAAVDEQLGDLDARQALLVVEKDKLSEKKRKLETELHLLAGDEVRIQRKLSPDQPTELEED